MNILAFDTVSSSFSIALLKDSKIEESNFENITNHNTELLKELDFILKKNNTSLSDISFIALGKGPGSFTALRIAFSTIKAISYCSNIPIITISSLKALYKNIEYESGLKIAMIDARKESVYASIYYDDHTLYDEVDIKYSDIISVIEKNTKNNLVTITGDGYSKNKEVFDNMLESYKIKVKNTDNIIHAKHILSLAKIRFGNNDFDNIFNIEPSYLRKSEAEIKKV